MTGHFKIIFSDIDGTLLDSKNRVPVKTREAILELEQRGIPFVLISARSPEGMEPIKRELGNHAPMVSYCSGQILDADGNILSEKMIQFERAVAMKDMFDREYPQLSCSTYGGSKWIVDDDQNAWVRGEEAITGLKASVGSVAEQFAALGGVHKFLLMGEPREIRSAQERIRQVCPDLFMVASKPEYLEIMEGTVKKSAGLCWLCSHFGIPVEESIAFGDGLNDVDMLQAAGRGYAMANAPAEVRERVAHTAPDNDHEGILAVLQELFDL